MHVPPDAIQRYDYVDRASHWLLAVFFFLAGLSGLAFFHPAFFWLTDLFGGGAWTRILHPYLGIGMAIFFFFLGWRVLHHNLIDRTDVAWLMKAHHVMSGREDLAPPAGRYNAGQKVLYWLLMLCMLGLVVTGFCFWRPYADALPVTLIRLASLLHAVCAIGLILLVMGHIYMSFWTKESIRAMTQGWVTRRWAGRITGRGMTRSRGRVDRPSSMQAPLPTPEEIAVQQPVQVPFLRLPGADVFADRARRLRMLAPGHAMSGYLEFIALVADAQQDLLERMPPIRLPAREHLAQCREHGIPPLDFQTHVRDPQWRNALHHLLRLLADRTTGRTAEVVAGLEGSRDDFYEAQASKLLAGVASGLDIAAAPVIAAGLQVYFTHLAITLGAEEFRPIDIATICPCCGSKPVASIVRIGGDAAHRFLHCALCNAEWHMVRIKCPHCESTKGISYHVIDDGAPLERKAVKAEACGECGTYLKICLMDRNPQVDPVADDLATLALDLLVVDTWKTPAGINYMLIHGDPIPE